MKDRAPLGEEVELFAGLEADGLSGGDGDLGAGAWVAADAGFAGFDGEDAEAAEFDAISGDEGLFHAFEDGVDGGLGFASGKSGSLYHPLNEVLLNHLSRCPCVELFRGRRTLFLVG